jgi:hypothetical protein
MSGRKYIGTIVFNQNIDQYSKSKKESLKSEIYDKMVSNEYFIKNIELGGGHFLSHKNKTIKLKGDKAIVEFKETVSPFNDTYKKKNKDKSMFNWAQKNFKRSMNFNKKMFLDDSLKAVKVSVKTKSNSGPKKTITKSKARLKSKTKKSKRYKKSKNKKGGGEKRTYDEFAAGAGDAGGAAEEPETFDCDYNCGFKGSYEEAVSHESVCPLRPLEGESEEIRTLASTTIPSLSKHDNKEEICDIKADERVEYNCSINSFSVIDRRFHIDDDKIHDYVITVDEPTRIYYGPDVTDDTAQARIKCFRTENDEFNTDTEYRTLNHNCLAKNGVVIAAGRVKKNGNNLTFDNISGHYQGDLTQEKQDYIKNLVSMIQSDYTCDFDVKEF